MQSSSPSKAHSTQVPIKVLHRQYKKTNRRKRVDLECGCSYYLGIDCRNHGFTHRGTHHCSSGNEWRLYLAGPKSPIFHDPQPRQPAIQLDHRPHIITGAVQPQPSESVGDTQMFSNLPNLDDLTASDWSFLKGL
ncbi:TrAP [Chilli leaf curl Vellanad virus [India/Vellanad/2008]]|uniref:Transcriptional activator protein n=1 Tax=Chilli leaf curl Vellanad virus TaxID=2050929 RepID=H6SSU9_9GEMI|nr:TrAP [Chilli leaf curl Vellanad virus [India/Vellanad/2008]]AEA76859.1 TrAP [Chilli leaf curl Vellanad virus [India/Vellanad/2008]]